jgi:hypothetical protein
MTKRIGQERVRVVEDELCIGVRVGNVAMDRADFGEDGVGDGMILTARTDGEMMQGGKPDMLVGVYEGDRLGRRTLCHKVDVSDLDATVGTNSGRSSSMLSYLSCKASHSRHPESRQNVNMLHPKMSPMQLPQC